MKNIYFLFSLMMAIPAVSQVSGDIIYQEYGISFTIPNQWVGQESEDIFVMASSKEAGLLILMFHPAKNQQELVEKMNKGLKDQLVNLSPVSSISKIGTNKVAGIYQGTLDGQNVKGKAIAMINPYGKGIVVFSLINETRYAQRTDELADLIANSVAFSMPNTKVAPVSKYLQEAKKELMGYKLTYLESYYSNTPGGGGYERKRVINLCPNGLFTFYGGSYLNFPDPNWDPMQENAKGHGSYEILEDSGNIYLQLNYNDGGYESLKCTYDEGLYLNGGRYYRGDVECY